MRTEVRERGLCKYRSMRCIEKVKRVVSCKADIALAEAGEAVRRPWWLD